MKLPENLDFKMEGSNKLSSTNVYQLSPITGSCSPLMQQYQRKMQRFLLQQGNALSFQNIQTPGWSTLVQTDKPPTKRTEPNTCRQQILKKVIHQPKISIQKNKQQTKPRSPRYSDMMNNKLHTNSSYAKLRAPPPGMNLASELTERSREQYPSKTNKTSESAKKLPKKQIDSSRFKQISVHDHLYLDSKRQQAKRMMHKMVDEEFKKNIMSFQPKISHYTELLAQNRFKKLQDDPDYRCSKKKNQTRKSTPKVQDPNEIQYRHLHVFFTQLTNGNHSLSRNTLTVENIPLPCLRSIEPILEQIFMGANLTWNNFLDLFYSKSLNRKTFFQILKQKQKRSSKIDWTRSKLMETSQGR